jgi:purine-binding chemotaxis protein CheW
MKHNQDNQFIAFRLENEEFGIFITEINEIIIEKEITPLAKTSKTILGMINLRGVIIPIIDLRIHMNKKATTHKKNRIIITTINEQKIGLLVDEVTKVLKINEENIENCPDMLFQHDTNYVHYLYKSEGKVIVLLKLENLLKSDDLYQLSITTKEGK